MLTLPTAGTLRAMVALLLTFVASATPALGQAPAARPMTFLDVQLLQTMDSAVVSPDGRWMAYSASAANWDEGKRQTDLHLVSTQQGVASARQLTFTADKNERAPRWTPGSDAVLFASNRDAPSSAANQSQLYLMPIDGGEARRITEAKDGVSSYSVSPDGRWLVYRAGKSEEQQLYRVPLDALATAPHEQITRQPAGIQQWEWAPDSRRIYFVTPDSVDLDEKLRKEKKFSVVIRNPETPTASLWAIDLETLRPARLTRDPAISVAQITVSPDGRWVGFRGLAADRYRRNLTEQNLNSDLYLLETATGQVERLTDNEEIGEGELSFSPDGRRIAFSAPDDLTRYSMKNRRVYLRDVADRGGSWRKLGGSFDGDVTIGFWSDDGTTIYFDEGVRATNQLLALDVERDRVRQITSEKASVTARRDPGSGTILINYTDPETPPTLFAVPSPEAAADHAAWRQLTDLNPQVRGFALGDTEEITWRSTDGKTVGGVLVRPVGYHAGRQYPLIVAIHGGPASADVLRFNGGYGAQVYAGDGYAVLLPNYRGSTNYGEAHKTDIVGDYFRLGYEDIMTGVDHLIEQGIVDGSRMGVLGWSAGGHWSNWILVNTDRFRAISSGAGTSNWISMYAQSDVQRNRQFYLGDKLPYDDFDAYWNQSPLKYIRNARTPTMIHVVEGDPRVPSPQSVELHMALKKLGVPTELFMYPGDTHGIPDPRNRLVKSVSEKAWMDHYVTGTAPKFAWRDVLKILDAATQEEVATPAVGASGGEHAEGGRVPGF